MKNKEIEELLNQIKFEYSNKEKWRTDLALTVDGWNLLLSYIEQLEKDNKDLDKENQILFETNMELQNKLNKAIEYVDVNTNKGIYESDFGRGTAITICKEHLLSILKGGSDE